MPDGTLDYYATTRKRVLMKAVLRLCRELRRGGREYHVRRGAMNWANHDFAARPFAMSVHCDNSSFIRGEGNNQFVVSLEIMTRMPDGTEETDDDLLDDLTEDAATVFEKLEEERDPDDEALPVVTRLDRTNDSAIEVSDQSRLIQGLVVTVTVDA